MEVITETEKKNENLVIKKEVTINYEQSIDSVCGVVLPPSVKYVSDDILKTKLNVKNAPGFFGGLRKVELALFDFGANKCHNEAKTAMRDAGFENAGLHEILHFADFVSELSESEKEFSITALRDEMIERTVEFVPTIYVPKKKSLKILMCYRADLPFKHSYFLGVKYL